MIAWLRRILRIKPTCRVRWCDRERSQFGLCLGHEWSVPPTLRLRYRCASTETERAQVEDEIAQHANAMFPKERR